MKIKKFTYHNKSLDWQLKPVEFSELNLLVGGSGVGKTRILKAILDLKEIANGEYIKLIIRDKLPSGVSWNVEFSLNGTEYLWEGEFENTESSRDFNYSFIGGKNKSDYLPKIAYERLYSKNDMVVDRKGAKINFKGDKLPVKLSAFESAVSLFREDDNIAPIYKEFTTRLIESRSEQSMAHSYVTPGLLKKHNTLEAVQHNDFNTLTKLAMVYKNLPDIFRKIKEEFIHIFAEVEDMMISLKPIQVGDLLANDIILYIKENDVENWIHHNQISSGMFKSLMFISNMYLRPEGTTILIDEFENGLGLNCMNILDELMLKKRNLQYIITSHHPYIINSIPMNHWKIVTRKGSVVTVRDAREFNLGSSKHKAFMQLMELEAFIRGAGAV